VVEPEEEFQDRETGGVYERIVREPGFVFVHGGQAQVEHEGYPRMENAVLEDLEDEIEGYVGIEGPWRGL
jgi:hypothetical protein